MAAPENAPADSRSPADARPPPATLREFCRHLGPGLIITACIVGSGELIATTKLGADAGFALLWLIIIGCVIKVLVQVEFGRYSISHGGTTLQAMNLIPGPRLIVSWLCWCWLAMYLAVVCQVAGIVGSVAKVFSAAEISRSADSVLVSDRFWAVVVAVSCAALLVIGRYRLIERVSVTMVSLFTVCTIGACGALQWTQYGLTSDQIAAGLSFTLPEGAELATAFAAFGIIGVGASELIYYPYWCIEKGYARFVGPPDGTQEWTARAQGWIRVMRVDAWLSMVVYTVATIAFYLLGAAVLHENRLKVDDESELIPTLSKMYESTIGQMGTWIFLLGAFFVLYSTFFVATASNARLLADALPLFRVLRYKRDGQRATVVRVVSVLIPTVTLTIFWFYPSPVALVLIGAFAQSLLLPLLAVLAIYLSWKHTSAALRPGMVWCAGLWVTFAAMAAWTVYQFMDPHSKARQLMSWIYEGLFAAD